MIISGFITQRSQQRQHQQLLLRLIFRPRRQQQRQQQQQQPYHRSIQQQYDSSPIQKQQQQQLFHTTVPSILIGSQKYVATTSRIAPWYNTTTTTATTGRSYKDSNIQRQQYRTKLKLIDFDQFEPEAMAEKEAKMKKGEYIVGYKKIKYREKREQMKERLEAEEKAKYIFRYDIWEATIDELLNVEIYPVGFTNTYDSPIIASWCQQLSHTLQQTLSLNASMSLESVLKLLDRLFQEQEAHIPNHSHTAVQVLMSPDISSSAIECALKSWKFSLLYPPYYERMTVGHVERAQERVQYYGSFLAKHDESMLGQISQLLTVDRIVHTKTTTTDRILWGHIPHTKHPNAVENNARVYMNYMNQADVDQDIEAGFFEKDKIDPNERDGYLNNGNEYDDDDDDDE